MLVFTYQSISGRQNRIGKNDAQHRNNSDLANKS